MASRYEGKVTKRGPPPKPTALKELEGNPGNRQLPKNEPKIDKAPKTAQPPKHLSKDAKAEWRRLYPVLRACGLISIADLTAFGIYCQLYGRWVDAERQIGDTASLLKTPNGHVQSNPWITISRQTAELMKSYMIEFGMTPAARARIGSSLMDPPPAQSPGQPEPPPVEGGRFTGLIGKTVN